MNRLISLIGLGLALILASPLLVLAEETSVERIGQDGAINWQLLKVSAKGTGVAPPKAQNQAQARALAQRAAVTIARRNLLEVVKGVRLDSTTKVENFLVTDDRVNSAVQGVLQNALVEEVVLLPDGSYQATVSTALTENLGAILFALGKSDPNKPAPAPFPQSTVNPEMAAKISELERRLTDLEAKMAQAEKANAEAHQDILAKIETNKATVAQPVVPAPVTVPVAVSVVVPEQKIPFTGLVIDAQGLGFKPCLRPALHSADGSLFYPAEVVRMDVAVQRGYVRYYRDIGQAQRSGVVGSTPQTVKAEGLLSGPGNIKLSTEDSALLKRILSSSPNFLEEGKVIIVF